MLDNYNIFTLPISEAGIEKTFTKLFKTNRQINAFYKLVEGANTDLKEVTFL